MTLSAFIIECYNSAKASRRAESCGGAGTCICAMRGDITTTEEHSVKVINFALRPSLLFSVFGFFFICLCVDMLCAYTSVRVCVSLCVCSSPYACMFLSVSVGHCALYLRVKYTLIPPIYTCLSECLCVSLRYQADIFVQIIRLMNHVATFSVIKHRVHNALPNEDIKILGSCGSMQQEQLRLMDASRSISLGKFLSLVFSDSTLPCAECGKHLFREHGVCFEYQDAQIHLKYEDMQAYQLSHANPTYFADAPVWGVLDDSVEGTMGVPDEAAAGSTFVSGLLGPKAHRCRN